jgi:hypothetical protein
MADTRIKTRASNIDLEDTFDFSSGTITVGTPSSNSEATPKSYVDAKVGVAFQHPDPVSLSSASTTVTFTGKQAPTEDSAVILVRVNNVPIQVRSSNSSLTEVADVVLSNSGSDLVLTFNASLNAGDIVVLEGHLG